ncbi:MAG: metal ABC transporter ATP-binding protein, partial [Candidatus Muiribacteriaceae bacterium]
MNVVEIRDVYYSIKEETILENISLTVRENEFLALIGPNGGGKTTLLKLLLGIIKPDSGEIRISGKKPGDRTNHIGYIPQNINNNSDFPASVKSIIETGFSYWDKKSEDRIQEVAQKLGVSGILDKKIGELSGGQLQRTLLGRAIISGPKLLLLDEPTASVDSAGQKEIYDLLKDLNRNMTIIMVSHDIGLMLSYADSLSCVNR